MRPAIFLHIGTEKTGTTSIQTFFQQNRELLAKQGVLYPVSPGIGNHIKLAAYAERSDKIDDLRKVLQLTDPRRVEEFRTSFQRQFAAEIAASRPRKVVLSGEHCSSRLLQHSEIGDLARLLSDLGSPIKIIVYLRRQDGFLLSTYSTGIKFGATQRLTLPSEEVRTLRYDYLALIDRWSEVFGRENMLVRSFDKDRLESKSLYVDICGAVGIDLSGDFVFPERRNVGLGSEALEFLRRINQHLPRFVGNAENPLRGNIVEILERRDREISTSGVKGSSEDLSGFYRSFKTSNEALETAYGDGPGSLLPTDSLPTGIGEAPELSLDKAIAIMAVLWSEKQQEVMQLRRVIEGLRKASTQDKPARDSERTRGGRR